MTTNDAHGYLHGFTPTEQDRLRRQARFLEHKIHDQLPFRRVRHLLEVGCGVGAQTDILLRTWPEMRVTGVDASESNLDVARRHLANVPWATDRYELHHGDAGSLDFGGDSFDGAFLCWVLEHVPDPARVLSEVRRVLRPGSPIVVTEVQNGSFFIDPYSPNTLAYWMAFNDRQLELGGDPFIGAKLGNILQGVGYRDITTKVRTFHLDNRHATERAEFLAFWTELLLSGCDELLKAGAVTEEIIAGMREELHAVAHASNSVFFYSFIQARARVW